MFKKIKEWIGGNAAKAEAEVPLTVDNAAYMRVGGKPYKVAGPEFMRVCNACELLGIKDFGEKFVRSGFAKVIEYAMQLPESESESVAIAELKAESKEDAVYKALSTLSAKGSKAVRSFLTAILEDSDDISEADAVAVNFGEMQGATFLFFLRHYRGFSLGNTLLSNSGKS
ncbi:MAG: hypothetical protein IAF08_10160 [Rhizobacter sp.]|nr:hypothetical protein [Chlorobiales bacterium]